MSKKKYFKPNPLIPVRPDCLPPVIPAEPVLSGARCSQVAPAAPPSVIYVVVQGQAKSDSLSTAWNIAIIMRCLVSLIVTGCDPM